MFWGLIMEPNKRYTQIVEQSFHLSMASLDLLNADDKMAQVMLCYGGRNYLLCSLSKETTWQVPLDLNFQEGTKIAFTCNGQGHVHLTGYLIPDEDLDLDELEEEEDDEEEHVSKLADKHSKRKALDSPKETKKIKKAKQETDSSSGEEDDVFGESDDDSEEYEEDEDDDNDNDIDEEGYVQNDDNADNSEDDDNDEDENAEDQDKKKRVKSHDKKNKQLQQQPQQKKREKIKLINGKEIKLDQLNNKEKKNKGEQQQNAQNEQKKKTVEGGVQVEEIKVGSGTAAKAGKFITVYYVGRLKNGKKFDATTQGEGFKFRLGKGEVIKGWDVGIIGMKVGGKRRITIPPAMAYGAKGSPPLIPGNSTLVFEVELRNIH